MRILFLATAALICSTTLALADRAVPTTEDGWNDGKGTWRFFHHMPDTQGAPHSKDINVYNNKDVAVNYEICITRMVTEGGHPLAMTNTFPSGDADLPVVTGYCNNVQNITRIYVWGSAEFSGRGRVLSSE